MDRNRDPLEYLETGQAWADFCDGLKAAGADVLRETAPKQPIDLAEGHRYLARMVRFAFEQIVEGGDARQPVFFGSLHETLKSGWDNPDNHHTNAYISGEFDYRVFGTRGDSHTMSLAVYGGSLGREGGRRTVAYVTLDELEVQPDGRFEVILSPTEHPGNWIQTAPDATTLMVRETFWDKRNQQRAELGIERIGGEPVALDPEFMVSALRRSLRFIRGSAKIFFDQADEWLPYPNQILPGDDQKKTETLGIPNQYYASGWWEIGPDEAIVVDLTPPECRYWGFALCDYWGGSFDYRYWNVHTNKQQALRRGDGSVRVVVAHRDPGLADANWLSTAEHQHGVWNLRWLETAAPPVLPEVRVVAHDDLAKIR